MSCFSSPVPALHSSGIICKYLGWRIFFILCHNFRYSMSDQMTRPKINFCPSPFCGEWKVDCLLPLDPSHTIILVDGRTRLLLYHSIENIILATIVMSVATVVEKPSIISSLSEASRRKRRLSVQFQDTTDDDMVEVTTKYPTGFFYTRAETDR